MIIWIGFLMLIFCFLAIDLGILNKKDHVIRTREAALWTSLWVSIALGFSFAIHWLFSSGFVANPTNLEASDAVLKYITGYLIELSLSVDNVFVIAIIFKAFAIPAIYQHRVLFWGILGAIVFRALMILFGVTLINQFDWIIYVFGAFLIYTAIKMFRSDFKYDPNKSFVFRQVKKIYPLTTTIHGNQFFMKRMGLNAATPLFVALIVIELTDILFALDSIPAILAITADPFLVFSSNIMAILGLRSMYFLVSRMLAKFRHIHYSLAVILAFVGVKMLSSEYWHIKEWISLTIIIVSLAAGIAASLLLPEKDEDPI